MSNAKTCTGVVDVTDPLKCTMSDLSIGIQFMVDLVEQYRQIGQVERAAEAEVRLKKLEAAWRARAC